MCDNLSPEEYLRMRLQEAGVSEEIIEELVRKVIYDSVIEDS